MTYTHLHLDDFPANRELDPDETLMVRLAIAVGYLAHEAGDDEIIVEITQALAEWMHDRGLKPC